MNEERKMILQMLSDGNIDVDEAARLLDAVPEESAGGRSAEDALTTGGGPAPKRLHVLVSENGKTKVNVKVPFSLVRAGLKIGKTFGAMGAVNSKDPVEADALNMLKDIDVDEILSALHDGEISLPYVMVDVDSEEENQQVRVVLE